MEVQPQEIRKYLTPEGKKPFDDGLILFAIEEQKLKLGQGLTE